MQVDEEYKKLDKSSSESIIGGKSIVGSQNTPQILQENSQKRKHQFTTGQPPSKKKVLNNSVLLSQSVESSQEISTAIVPPLNQLNGFDINSENSSALLLSQPYQTTASSKSVSTTSEISIGLPASFPFEENIQQIVEIESQPEVEISPPVLFIEPEIINQPVNVEEEIEIEANFISSDSRDSSLSEEERSRRVYIAPTPVRRAPPEAKGL